MLNQIIIFASSLVLGFLAWLAFLLISKLSKRLKNRAATITIEFLVAGIFVCMFAGILFFLNNGVLAFFPIIALIKGVLLGSLITKPTKK